MLRTVESTNGSAGGEIPGLVLRVRVGAALLFAAADRPKVPAFNALVRKAELSAAASPR